MRNTLILILTMTVCAVSCATTSRGGRNTAGEENPEEAITAMESVVSAISGRPVNQEDLRNLGREIRRDEDTRNAVATITNSMGGAVAVKYCPVDGERYSPKFTECPVHHVPLKNLDE